MTARINAGMDADWSVECGGDDPFVVKPWQNADGTLTYIDLKKIPEAIEKIPEARLYPALAAALRRWNAASSPLFTAKCDVWSYPASLFDAEDLDGFAFARGSYVDLISTTLEMYRDFATAETQLRRWTEMARAVAAPNARCEWILRRASVAQDRKDETAEVKYRHGYATTLYVWGYGMTEESAAAAWACALEQLTEPALAAAAATIEQ